MPSLPTNLDAITPGDIEALVTNGAAESLLLEFKAAPYPGGQDGGREFLKDISALANTGGGWLIIGVQEQGGAAVAITPVTDSDADKMTQRLESLLQSGVEPRIPGTRMRAIAVEGGYVLVVRVPPSRNLPHRVTAQNSNRVYLRSAAGAYEASYQELQAMFLQSATAIEKFTRFREQRCRLIKTGETPLVLADEPDKLVIHISPATTTGTGATLDMVAAEQLSGSLRPIGASGWNIGFNLEGLIVWRGGDACYGYTQLFRDGSIEAVKVGLRREGNGESWIFGGIIEEVLLGSVPEYVAALEQLGLTPPFYVGATMLSIKGAMMSVGNHSWMLSRPAPVRSDDLALPACIIEDSISEANVADAMRIPLDAIWNAAGRPKWIPG